MSSGEAAAALYLQQHGGDVRGFASLPPHVGQAVAWLCLTGRLNLADMGFRPNSYGALHYCAQHNQPEIALMVVSNRIFFHWNWNLV